MVSAELRHFKSHFYGFSVSVKILVRSHTKINKTNQKEDVLRSLLCKYATVSFQFNKVITLFEAADPDCEGDEDEVGDCTDCPVGAIGRISTDSTALPPPPPPGV